MSNSGQFITIQRAKEKNQTEQCHLPTSVCYEKNRKRKIHNQGNTVVYILLIYFGQADEGHKTLVPFLGFCSHYSHEL